jgi:hypothetical protein
MPSTAPVQEWSNLWTDNYTTADYVAYTDTDAVFVTKVGMHASAYPPAQCWLSVHLHVERLRGDMVIKNVLSSFLLK